MKRFSLLALVFLLITSASCSALTDSLTLPTQVPTIALPTNPASPQPTAQTATVEQPIRQSATPASSAPIWVANPPDQVVVKIDPATNTITASVHVDGAPEIVVVNESGVWALDRKNNRLFRINPKTQQVIAQVDLPPGHPETLAAGSEKVWVGTTGMLDLLQQAPGEVEELAPPSWILTIDPASNQIVDQFAIQPVKQMTLLESKLWILSQGVIDTPIQIIDPERKQGWAVPLRNAPEWLPADAMAVDSQNLWLLSTAYGRIFHANSDGEIMAAVNLEGQKPTGYPDLLLSGDSLWAATSWGTVLQIDTHTNHVKGQIDLGIPLTSLIADPGGVWVTSQQTGQVFRIDAQTNSVVAQIATGSALEPTVVPSPTPRIVVWKPCPEAPTSRLKVGDIAYVTKDPPISNRVRQEPSREAEILGLVHPGTSMDIIEGPACAEGWVWWKIKNAVLEGWTAEGDQESYWLIPLYQ